MRILLDANLSWRIIQYLNNDFDIVLHVEQVLPLGVNDIEIWRYAKENSLTIITNDEDFMNLLNLFRFPPKVILLKTGNQTNRYLTQLLLDKKSDIENLIQSETYGLLEIV